MIAFDSDDRNSRFLQTLQPGYRMIHRLRINVAPVEKIARDEQEINSVRNGVLFNHVLVNRYRSGEDSMGLHADDEPELGPDPVVAIVSLGTARRLVIKPRRKADRTRRDLELGHGALLVMGGACQRHYVHGVPRQAGIQGERISLTFRRLLRAP